jgi:hypothetical protein
MRLTQHTPRIDAAQGAMDSPRHLIWFLATLTVTGCAESKPAGHITRVDSAGIEIVTIDMLREPVSNLWSADAAAQLEIGAADGPDHLILSGVVGAVRLSNGRIVIANGASSELRIFASDGQFVRSVGGNGEGPGEFRVIGYLGVLPGDTILVYDSRLRRLSRFDQLGTFVDSRPITGIVLPYLVGAHSQHEIGAWQFIGADDDRLGIFAAPMEFGTIDSRTGAFRAMDTLPASEEARVQYRGRATRAFRPFGREGDLAAGGGLIYALTSSDDRSIRAYDPLGQLRRVLRLNVARVSPDADAILAWTGSWIDRFSPGVAEIEEQWQHGFR